RHLHPAHGRLGFFQIRQQLLATVVVGAAHFGQAHPACRAVEQSRAEPFLELLDMLAYHARRDAEGCGRGRETASLNDPGEDPHAFEAVHVTSLLICAEKYMKLNSVNQRALNS